MRLFADESVEREIIQSLRQAGHEVTSVAEIQPGITDDQVLNKARQADVPLLTNDKDFGALIFLQHRLSSGVLLLRLPDMKPYKKADLLKAIIKQHSKELSNAFIVVTEDEIRIRPL